MQNEFDAFFFIPSGSVKRKQEQKQKQKQKASNENEESNILFVWNSRIEFANKQLYVYFFT